MNMKKFSLSILAAATLLTTSVASAGGNHNGNWSFSINWHNGHPSYQIFVGPQRHRANRHHRQARRVARQHRRNRHHHNHRHGHRQHAHHHRGGHSHGGHGRYAKGHW